MIFDLSRVNVVNDRTVDTLRTKHVRCISLHNADKCWFQKLLSEREMSADLTRATYVEMGAHVATERRWIMIITRKCCRDIWRVVYNHSQSAGHKRESRSRRLMTRGITPSESSTSAILLHVRTAMSSYQWTWARLSKQSSSLDFLLYCEPDQYSFYKSIRF